MKLTVLPVPPGTNDVPDPLLVMLPAIFIVLARFAPLLISNAVVPPGLVIVRFPSIVKTLDALVNVMVAILCRADPPV